MIEISPIEKRDNIFFKREDLALFGSINGGKGRVINHLIKSGIEQGYKNFVSCGGRTSIQCEMISSACEDYKVKCHLFIPNGHDTQMINNINKNIFTEIIKTDAGYVSILKKRTLDYAQDNNYFYIPFGLEDNITIKINENQVQNIPDEVKRIVVPIGSGMNFISIIKGLEKYNKNIPVLGVQTSVDPTKNIKEFLKETNIKYEIIKSELSNDKSAENYIFKNIELNKTYEAKCIPYIKDYDLLWIVGKELHKEQSTFPLYDQKIKENDNNNNNNNNNNKQITFNDLNREFIEDFISKMNKEEKQKLKKYINDNPRDSSGKLFVVVKSYIYRTYFKKEPMQEKKKDLFSDALTNLLNIDDD